jgi:hypothetical protein
MLVSHRSAARIAAGQLSKAGITSGAIGLSTRAALIAAALIARAMMAMTMAKETVALADVGFAAERAEGVILPACDRYLVILGVLALAMM